MSTDSQTHVPAELRDNCEQFLKEYYRNDILKLAEGYPSERQSLHVSWTDLYQHDNGMADDALEQPELVAKALEGALAEFPLPIDVDLSGASVRIHDLHDSDTYDVGEYRSEHIDERIAVAGQVTKVSKVKPRIEHATFECQRCGTLRDLRQTGDELQEPHECQGCDRQGPFRILHDQSVYTDHQQLRLQKPPEKTKGGDSEHIDVSVTDDMVGAVDPGDRADLTGKLRVEPDESRVFDLYLDGEAADVTATDFEDIEVDEHLDRIKAIANSDLGDPYQQLIDSLAPKVRGHDAVKESIMLQMFGGTRVTYPDGSIDRGDSHILLLGDPGTAKSSLLRAVDELAPRSVYASGKGMSAAGATAAAVRDDFGDTQWALEAGALVLANKGVACIDELDKVKEEAVSSMHDALESQIVDVHKAGINASLPSQTSLLAAGNPKYGRFDPDEAIAEQIDLGPTILSRFDLLFMMNDEPDEEQDKKVAKHMIEGRRTASELEHDPDGVDESRRKRYEPTIAPEVVRAYIAHAKQNYFPRIQDPDVEAELTESFTQLRVSNGEGSQSPVPVTYRKLEAIERLAEASARVRLSNEVTSEDIARAKRLVGTSLKQVGMDPETNQFDADIIESNASRAQADRIPLIRDITRELQQQSDKKGARVNDIYEEAAKEGIDADKVDHTIQLIRDQGDGYHPDEAQNYLRVL